MLNTLYYRSHLIYNSSYKFILSFIISFLCSFFINPDSAFCMTSDSEDTPDYKKLYEESQALIAEHRRIFETNAREGLETVQMIQLLHGEYRRMETENHELLNHAAQLESALKRVVEENQTLRKYIQDRGR